MDFNNYFEGQTILVELTNGEIYEGLYESGSRDRVDLSNIYDHPYRNYIPGNLSFYRSEILNIRLLKENAAANVVISVREKFQNKNIILLNKCEYKRLQSLAVDHTYICTMDKRYFDATEMMINCENVAVVALNMHEGRMSTFSLLVMATWNQIFIFDIQQFIGKKFPFELQEIFESEYVKKIIHGSRAFVDCLYHMYNIKNIKNIFDTEVADIIIQKRENRNVPTKFKSLSECLSCYLNFPSSVIESALKVKPQTWKTRPISNLNKFKAAQLVVYLISVKNCMEQIILKDVNNAMQVHYQSTIKLNAYDSSQSLLNNEIPKELLSVL